MIKILLVVLLLFSSAADKFLSAQPDINDFHYEPVEGKSIGISPNKDLGGKTDFEYYRNQLGFYFTMVLPRDSSWQLSTEQYENATAAGYDPASIMINMRFDNIDYCVENLPASRYYLGEPTEHNCSGNPSNGSLDFVFNPSQLDSVRQKIISQHPNSEFVIDGYKRCSHLIIASDEADQIMYSSYENWNEISWNCTPELGWGENTELAWTNFLTNSDQSDSWEDMWRLFGGKFSMSWMHGKGDEYAELFETADDIGLNAIWLYALTLADTIDGQPTMDTLQLQSFCDVAYEKGWLQKVYDMDFFSPYNLHAQEIEIGVVTLTWEDSTDYPSGYIIEKKTYPDSSFALVDSLDSFPKSYIDSNVVENKTYLYRIYSYTDKRNSIYSDTVTITTSVRPIKAPSDLQAEFENNFVMLFWQDNSENENNFFIERKLNDSGEFNLIDSTEMNSVAYIDSSIASDWNYQYRIFAGNENALSDYSDTITVSTAAIPVAAPSDLQAEFENNLVMLSWQDNSDNEDSFIIERKLNEASEFILVDSTEIDVVEFIDSSIVSDGVYHYRIFAENKFTRSEYSDTVEIDIILTGVEDLSESYSFNLSQNYPNPFNPSTVIEYSIPVNSRQYDVVSSQEQTIVTLKIYDALGKQVTTLVNEHQKPGNYQVKFNAEKLSSGIYYYSISMNSYIITKKMLLLR